jgi:inhibitor of KinA
MSSRFFRIFPLHLKALLIQYNQQPSKVLLEKLLSFKILIEKEVKVSRCVMGYQSLLIHLNEEINNLSWWKHRLNELQIESEIKKIKINKGKLWKIPVCYDNKYAPDLLSLSKALKLEIDELIKIHTQTKYRIYFLGFLPGFLYLDGLDERLHFPRKVNPILNVPKGAVGIGGKQTGVYPNFSPGGWHLIGNTPISLFDIKQNPPCFASPGDWVSFTSIDQKTYNDLEKKNQKDKFKFLPYD